MKELEFHKLANIYPLADDKEAELIRTSIEESGQKHNIVLYEGKVLDGRNRYNACSILGIEPKTEVFIGSYEDAMKHSTELNSARRHTSKSQQAMTAARAVIKVRNDESGKLSVNQASIMFNVSPKYINRAMKIHNSSAVISKNIFDGKLTMIQGEKMVHALTEAEGEHQSNMSTIETTLPTYSEDEQYSYDERLEYRKKLEAMDRESLIKQIMDCRKKLGINTHK